MDSRFERQETIDSPSPEKTNSEFRSTRRVLIVDDDPDVRAIMARTLESEGFVVKTAETLESAHEELQTSTFDALLLDVFLANENSLRSLPSLLRKYPSTKIFVMTGQGSVDLAVEAMREGAASFIIKSRDPREVAKELKATIFSQYGITALHHEPLPHNLGLVGASPGMERVVDCIRRMADVDSTVLIEGESGTGKEVVARALHRLSSRAQNQFAAINCGAIPANLLEAELFGHKKSAFTDAKADRKGIFESCSGGTLLLDEIGELPLPLQVKLLRVLQEREVTPLGSSEPIPIDARVIVATNRHLKEEVSRGRFRDDLFYRISVLSIEIPPLRERKEDIPALAEHFINFYNTRFGKSVNRPSHEVIARLMQHNWPGNIRELRNTLERGIVLARDGILRLEDLFPSEAGVTSSTAGERRNGVMSYSDARKQFEQNYWKTLLDKTEGNISEASRLSGEYRTKIYRLLKRHNVEVSAPN